MIDYRAIVIAWWGLYEAKEGDIFARDKHKTKRWGTLINMVG